MERRSDLHNPRLDAELDRETQSITRGGAFESRTDDERLLEDAGDEEPELERVAAVLDDEDEGSPSLTRAEVRSRSELARHLRGSIFPADRDAIVVCAVEERASPDLIARLRALPDGRYRNVEGVWEALGGRRDERSPEGDVDDVAGAAERRAEVDERRSVGVADERGPALDVPAPVDEHGHVEIETELVYEAGPDDATLEAEPTPVEPDVLEEPGQPAPTERPSLVHARRFGFRFALPFRAAAMPFLVTPSSAVVALDPTADGPVLRARFGPWLVETPLHNVVGCEITGPYSLVKTIGPPHVSLADRGITFATNADHGVCIRFAHPVRGIDPLGLLRHPALTVTVTDVEGLRDALEATMAE